MKSLQLDNLLDHVKSWIYTYFISLAQIGFVQVSVYMIAKNSTDMMWVCQSLIAILWVLNKDNHYTKTKAGISAYMLGSVTGAQWVLKLVDYLWNGPLKSSLMAIAH